MTPPQNRQNPAWSPERRAAQSAMMRERQIWRKSTGPRTALGKARSSRNALKHGKRTIEWKLLRAIMANQKRLHHENATNELLDETHRSFRRAAVNDGLHLMRLFLAPMIMQKSCNFPSPAAKVNALPSARRSEATDDGDGIERKMR